MKNIKSHFKEIGITLSYLYMLIACYLFDWKPFGIFISYLIEVVVLFLIYTVLRIRHKNQHPERYRKIQPIVNVFIGIIPLIGVQYLIIGLMAGSIDPGANFLEKDTLLSKEVLYALISTVVLYVIKALQFSDQHERLSVFESNFLYKVFALTITNLAGVLAVIGLGISSLLPVLTVMVIIRIGMEIHFDRKMRMV